jgi:hypothetical protein
VGSPTRSPRSGPGCSALYVVYVNREPVLCLALGLHLCTYRTATGCAITVTAVAPIAGTSARTKDALPWTRERSCYRPT